MGFNSFSRPGDGSGGKYKSGKAISVANTSLFNPADVVLGFTAGGSPLRIVYKDSNYIVAITSGSIKWFSATTGAAITQINFAITHSSSYDFEYNSSGTPIYYIEGNYIYMLYSNGTNAYYAKFDLIGRTKVFELAAPYLYVLAIYTDATYIYLVTSSSTNGATWNKCLKTDGSGLSANVAANLGMSSFNNFYRIGQYLYTHVNNGNISKMDIISNTALSLWTTSGASSFNYIYLTSLDTVTIAKGNTLAKFAFGNNTPIWSITLNVDFNNNYTNVGYVTSSDGMYIYCYIVTGRIVKVRLSDGAIIWEHGFANNFNAVQYNYIQMSFHQDNLYGVQLVDSSSDAQLIAVLDTITLK